MWLFLLFVGVPILEIALFIKVGGAIGLWPTLAIVVLTALAGSVLMRTQGLMTLARLHEALQRGENPADPLAQGAMILVAGVLLLTPGFFTDTVGLLLLLPPVRRALIAWAARHVVATGRMTVMSGGFSRSCGPDPDTIDADFTVLDGDEPGRRRGDGPPSGWRRD